MELMTVKEYALHRGVNFGTVYRNIKLGMFDGAMDGKKIDAEVADTIWAVDEHQKRGHKNGHPAKAIKKPSPSAKKPSISKEKKIKPMAETETIHEIKRQRELVKLQADALSLKIAQGKVFERDDINNSLFFALRAIRNEILNLKERIVPVIRAAQTDHAAGQIMGEELNALLTKIAETSAHPNLPKFKENQNG